MTLALVFSGNVTVYAHWSETPPTGDESNLALWSALLGMAMIGLAGLALAAGKKRERT